jgi:hypothetical protein
MHGEGRIPGDSAACDKSMNFSTIEKVRTECENQYH